MVSVRRGLMRMGFAGFIMGMGMGVGMGTIVIMTVVMTMVVLVPVVVFVVVFMVMGVMMARLVRVVVLVRQVDVKFNAGDRVFLPPCHMQVVAGEFQFGQFPFQFRRVHAQINQGRQKHVAADAAEEVEVKCFHAVTRRLIWLAA
jgi:hypothetical protein